VADHDRGVFLSQGQEVAAPDPLDVVHNFVLSMGIAPGDV
jgi:hypothetical protein